MAGLKDTSQFNKDLIKIYNGESDDEYFLEVNVQYHEKSHEFHNDLPFLPERMKTENVRNFVANLHDKTEYVIHIRNLNKALIHGLILRKVHRAISFNQNT